MEHILIDILETSGLGTLLFIMLLCFRHPIQKYCGIKFWNRALFIDAVLFIVPVYPLKLALSPIIQPFRAEMLEFISLFMDYPHFASAVSHSPNDFLYKCIIFVWAIGFMVFFLTRMVSYITFRMKTEKHSYEPPLEVRELFTNLLSSDKDLCKISRLKRIKLLTNGDFLSPFTYGFIQNRIVLPENIAEHYDESELRMMLRHEAIHIKQCDSWKRLLVVLIHSIHWFNPVHFLLGRFIHESIELCCDHEVIHHQNESEARFQYGELLLAMASNQRSHTLFGFFMSNHSFIKKRVYSVTTLPAKPHKLTTALVPVPFILAFVICLAGFTMLDSRMDTIRRINVIDYGEISEPSECLESTPHNNGSDIYDLSENEPYLFEIHSSGDAVNYTPVGFTGQPIITLTLQTDSINVVVFIYNNNDLDYPLMQMTLNGVNDSQTFTALSGNVVYSLGFVTDDVEARVFIN